MWFLYYQDFLQGFMELDEYIWRMLFPSYGYSYVLHVQSSAMDLWYQLSIMIDISTSFHWLIHVSHLLYIISYGQLSKHTKRGNVTLSNLRVHLAQSKVKIMLNSRLHSNYCISIVVNLNTVLV